MYSFYENAGVTQPVLATVRQNKNVGPRFFGPLTRHTQAHG